MSSFVLDCSVTMAWCFPDEHNDKAEQVLRHLTQTKALVPEIWALEVNNVLHIAERKKRITPTQSNTFIHLLNGLPIEIGKGLNERPSLYLLDITRQFNISAYDAAYLELALRQSIPLASFDQLLCSSAKKAGIALYI